MFIGPLNMFLSMPQIWNAWCLKYILFNPMPLTCHSTYSQQQQTRQQPVSSSVPRPRAKPKSQIFRSQFLFTWLHKVTCWGVASNAVTWANQQNWSKLPFEVQLWGWKKPEFKRLLEIWSPAKRNKYVNFDHKSQASRWRESAHQDVCWLQVAMHHIGTSVPPD